MASIAAAMVAGGSPSEPVGKRLAIRWRNSESEASGRQTPMTADPRHTIAHRPIGVSKRAKAGACPAIALFVVAGEVGVARRCGGGQAERLGRLAQGANLVRSILVVDLDALQV